MFYLQNTNKQTNKNNNKKQETVTYLPDNHNKNLFAFVPRLLSNKDCDILTYYLTLCKTSSEKVY